MTVTTFNVEGTVSTQAKINNNKINEMCTKGTKVEKGVTPAEISLIQSRHTA